MGGGGGGFALELEMLGKNEARLLGLLTAGLDLVCIPEKTSLIFFIISLYVLVTYAKVCTTNMTNLGSRSHFSLMLMLFWSDGGSCN